MRVVHFSDLHLGFRAFPKEERGSNLRERDVASAFQRGLQEAARLRPDFVLFSGDLFHHPDPPSSAFLTLTRGLRTLQALVPGVAVLAVAGERDTPVNPADPGPLAVLDALPGVEAAAGAPRAVRFRRKGIQVLLVPHRAARTPPFPDIRPDEEARWNILLIRGHPGSTEPAVRLDLEAWDYVAVGGPHDVRSWAPHVWASGSLERIGWDPWKDPTQEKGFVSFDLERHEGEFHPIPIRPVVDLAPLRADPRDPSAASRKLRHLLESIPGGIAGKLLRIRLEGDLQIPEEGMEPGLLEGARRRAAHVDVELEPEPALRPDPEESNRWIPIPVALPGSAGDGGLVPLEPGIHLVTAATPGDLDRVMERVSAEASSGLPPSTYRADVGGDGWDGELARVLWTGGPAEALLRAARALGGERGTVAEGRGVPEGTSGVPGVAGSAPEEVARMEAELKERRGDAVEAEGEAEARMLEWARDRQEAETRLQAYRDRARELRVRLRALEDGEVVCPTCGQELGDREDRLLETLRDEWETVVQDGRWWSRRREQLEDKPQDLMEMESLALRQKWQVGELAEALERARAARPRDADPGPGATAGTGELDARETKEEELGADARALRPFLARAGSNLRSWTEGRVSGFAPWEGGAPSVMERGVVRPVMAGEKQAVRLALHLALWTETWCRGLPVPAGLILTGLDARGLDPLLPLLESIPVSRLKVVVALPPGAPFPGCPVVRSLFLADGSALRRLPAGPATLVWDDGADGTPESAPGAR